MTGKELQLPDIYKVVLNYKELKKNDTKCYIKKCEHLKEKP